MPQMPRRSCKFHFQVYVCNSLANLYVKSPEDSDWKLKYEGIPVVILDRGESRARTKRCIKIALAERGTGFMLWHDIVDNLSSYKMEGPTFHTMCFSEDHKLQIGFSFDMCMAAEELGRHVETLVARPENVNLSTPGKISSRTRLLIYRLTDCGCRQEEKKENQEATETSASAPEDTHLAAVLLPTRDHSRSERC